MATDPLSLIQSIGSQLVWNAPMTLDAEMFPMALLACSMSGEDMLLRRQFKDKLIAGTPGIYVDIGCSMPIKRSNSYMFYCYGWRGVCIDANDYAADYARSRPRDKFVRAAISETAGEMFYHRHFVNAGASQVNNSPIGMPGFISPAVPVPSTRLETVLAEHLPGERVDFFTIDVEGTELGVLKSNDWNRWRPSVIMLECVNFDFDAPYATPTVRFLADQGYKLTGQICANVMMHDQVSRPSPR